MKALVLAGGFGTRIASIAEGKPKPLVEVRGKTILEHQIEYLLHHGIRDIRLSLHHGADQITAFANEKWPGMFEFVTEPVPLGTGGGIRYATRDWNETFLAFNCDDIIRNVNLYEFMERGSPTVLCRKLDDARGYGLVEVENGGIHKFSEKPKEKIAGIVNCGWYVIDPSVFNHIDNESFMMEYEVFPYLANQGKLKAYVHEGFWIGVGTEETHKQAVNELHNYPIASNNIMHN